MNQNLEDDEGHIPLVRASWLRGTSVASGLTDLCRKNPTSLRRPRIGRSEIESLAVQCRAEGIKELERKLGLEYLPRLIITPAQSAAAARF